MKFSENWLRSLVDLRVAREVLTHRLTMAGLEVEGLEPLGQGLDHVVVGEIVSAERHPNADKLQVCLVQAGAAEPLQIVCGAPNARVGLKAPVALIGANLPNGMAIKAAKLRGVDSSGMLCSAKELKLSDESSGLLELPTDAPVGQPLPQYLDLPDAAIEIKLTPNRPDCLGLAGLASELRALFGLGQGAAAAIAPVAVNHADTRAVQLAAVEDCPRYLGRIIHGVNAKAPTPLWMKQRLERSGLRSISAIVDATNYVMIELGQPMHAFDHEKLSGGIVVRRARDQETIKLLDEREVVLTSEFLIIADDRGAQAVAGVMGGYDSRVTNDTTSIYLEAAHFAPPAIIGRARKLGMHTDASHRFERGVDPELPARAIERLSQLIVEICGGQAGVVHGAESVEHLPKRPPVSLRRARLQRVIGMHIADIAVENLFRALDMQVTATTEGWQVTPPSRRFDIEIEEDLIEEVARIHGYDSVPTNVPRGELALKIEPEAKVKNAQIRQALLSRGYLEVLNFSFFSMETLQTWGLDQSAVALSNPLNADLAVMRPSLLPGLISNLKFNAARQVERLRLFELGKVFRAHEPPVETPRIAGVITGNARAEQWAEPRRPVDFFDLKGDVEHMLALAGPADYRFEPADVHFLHAGRSAAVFRGAERVGFIGCLDPRLAKKLDLDGDCYVFELDLAPIVQRKVPKSAEISRFPSVRRDLAMVVSQTVPASQMKSVAAAAAGPELKEIFVFDEFVGKGLPEGTRSLAMGLILQDESRTLTDADVEPVMARIVTALEKSLGAKLRG